MRASRLRTAHAALILTLGAGAAAGQTPGETKNHEFAVAAAASPRVWSFGGSQVAAGSITQAVVDSLSQGLAQKGFKKVQALNTDCCAIQVELVNATGRTVTAKITLYDLDKQNVYSKSYDGEAAQGGKGVVQSAATALVNQAFADADFLKKLGGT